MFTFPGATGEGRVITMPPPLDAESSAARLVCFGFDGFEMNSHCERMLDRGCGAVIIFARNIQSPKQVARLCASMKRRAHPRKLLIMVDQEGGRVARFGAPYFTSIPSARRVGESRDPVSAASEIGDIIGGECRAVNVDMTLAPVVDVNTNPHNEVIGDRAFGSRSKDVGQIASAFIRGCQAKGVAACAKHWPGHGDSNEDSHDVLPTVRHSYERLRNIEIPPFQDAIAAGVASVLVAHLCVPGMENFRVNNSEKGAGERDGETNKNIPLASCSKAVVGALRDQLGFNGVAMSDDMEMGALVNLPGGIGQAAVAGLHAGLDLFLVCHSEGKQNQVITALGDGIKNDCELKKKAMATETRLQVLCSNFVDGAEAAERNVRAFDSDNNGVLGGREQQRRVEEAIGVSRL
tara:strand:- start:23291 stop:24511 length:1221 start_codon:yes stop_codon:yes gene_type:complete